METKMPMVLDIISENIIKHGNPLALKGSEVASWAKELDLPVKGELLFYTGGEYQLLPFIDSLVKTITHLDQGSKMFSMMMGARNILNKTGINAEKMYASVLAKDKVRYNSVCLKAAKVLQGLGYEFCYAGNEELYSGALLYELGYLEDMKTYVQKVVEVIRKSGAKTIVCLSPHAAEVFKFVYPKMVEGFDFEIVTYVDLIWQRRDKLAKIQSTGPVVIHDSCRLARELGIHQELRDILESVGADVKEAPRNREWTSCCGGPIKILFPELSHVIGARRVNELKESGAEHILTSCPYCLSALEGGRAKGDSAIIEDLIEFLYRGVKA
ncbi:(Fe-S)-binding protein [Desulfosporosinus sp. BICA1-9]|uniref:(Fe-S)-binding protein n=1 Tax=Desulfosporosinus sp. BICA1-9 TaxID=1531958 RepID=UPI00054B63A1|nr:(Fe-S)-binding protein [Desulfosporosinus sp. BICA1-9]KJS49427.1 MAG: Fe-S oxidoreductase [Peptococcaceae bacterium BRH_c23]KJS79992.1 MAG: Fe-S oxidoreductase [Desulfosporosinus sp. BICA1-9]